MIFIIIDKKGKITVSQDKDGLCEKILKEGLDYVIDYKDVELRGSK